MLKSTYDFVRFRLSGQKRAGKWHMRRQPFFSNQVKTRCGIAIDPVSQSADYANGTNNPDGEICRQCLWTVRYSEGWPPA